MDVNVEDIVDSVTPSFNGAPLNTKAIEHYQSNLDENDRMRLMSPEEIANYAYSDPSLLKHLEQVKSHSAVALTPQAVYAVKQEYLKTYKEHKEDAERIKRMRDVAFRSSQKLTLEETETYRIIIGYRLTRYLLKHTGRLPNTGVMSDMSLDDWGINCNAPEPFKNRRALSVLHSAPLMAFNQFYKDLTQEDLPILPPPYSQDTKLASTIFIEMYFHIAQRLDIMSNPELGARGMSAFIYEEALHLCFPGILQLLHYEETLLESCEEFRRTSGRDKAENYLMKTHGFGYLEAQEFVNVAYFRTLLNSKFSCNEDLQRKYLVTMLEEIAERARSTLNFTAEVAAMKEIGSLLKLKRHAQSEQEESLAFKHAVDIEMRADLLKDGDMEGID